MMIKPMKVKVNMIDSFSEAMHSIKKEIDASNGDDNLLKCSTHTRHVSQ